MSRKIKSFVMNLWISWWNIVCLLRPAFSRARTFLWFLLVLAAFSVRNDLLGVSSFVRALGLSEHSYEHLLHFFHSNAVKTDRLAELWFAIVIKHFPAYKIGCRPVLVLDGIKEVQGGPQDACGEVSASTVRVQFQASLHHEPFLSAREWEVLRPVSLCLACLSDCVIERSSPWIVQCSDRSVRWSVS